jgi:hypothetical protein
MEVGFEVLTAVTVNSLFIRLVACLAYFSIPKMEVMRSIETLLYFYKTTLCHVRFEVFTTGTIKNAVFSDVAPCRSCVNRRFGGKDRLHLQGRKIRERGTSVSR